MSSPGKYTRSALDQPASHESNESSPEKPRKARDDVRAQSAKITQRNMLKRLQAREALLSERAEKYHMIQDRREDYLKRWKDKTKRSPFQTDLVAESEKITEETQLRTREEEEKKKKLLERRDEKKNEIILTALSEYSDLEALRQEKRAILEEEQRILALLALEKTSHQYKSDRIVAERALKQRQIAKTAYRRQRYREDLERIKTEEYLALKVKHGLAPLELLSGDLSKSSFFNGLSLSGNSSSGFLPK